MHAGSIDNPKSAAGRVYQILKDHAGYWWSGWQLTVDARVTAVGTRVSEVRHQLPAGQRIEHKTSHEGVHGSWYRLVVDTDVKAFIKDRLKTWEGRGVIDKKKLQAAIDNGTLIKAEVEKPCTIEPVNEIERKRADALRLMGTALTIIDEAEFPPSTGTRNHPCTLEPVCRYGQNG